MCIQNILFDLGMVLLELDYGPALTQMQTHCDPVRFVDSASFFRLAEQDPILQQYEIGGITSEAFFEHFVDISGFRGSMDTFQTIWRSIFRENIPMIDFGQSLANRYDIFFLSNAGALHVPYVYEAFPRLRFFKDDAVSCFLHIAKPNRAFYTKALTQFGIQAENSLFIDDRPENIIGAEACGIPSILYTTPAETIAAIQERIAQQKEF